MKQLSATVEVEVPFHDVDVMEVVWHGHYVKYFEVARCALLRMFDYDYPQMKESGYAWPIVECQLKYVRPARFGQVVKVKATLAEFENRLRINYEVRDKSSGERLTKGLTTQVAVDVATGELQLVSPPIVEEKLQLTWRNS
ncbi:MAG: acyl-CoA thioesterase [Rhodocyclaceae bacterium]|nr:MAG: acyl-CoA thioesterase [Rhodocyclaceae bacterium]